MEAILPALPELDPFRHDPVATPSLRLGNFTRGKLLLELGILGPKDLTGRDNTALLGNPRPEAAPVGTAEKIGQRLGGRNLLHASGNLDLTSERYPGKEE
jgi:hypothetical protein